MTDEDARLIDILTRTRVIACVGASPNPTRPSHGVSRFLQAQGYRVIPVNPGQAGSLLLGETAVASLSDIPPDTQVDFVDIFRRSEHVEGVVEEALDVLPNLRTIWLQLGVHSASATRLAEARGIEVVQNRCPKIEIVRLGLLTAPGASRQPTS